MAFTQLLSDVEREYERMAKFTTGFSKEQLDRMTGVFTDQGVVSEKMTVGKSLGQRTVIRIEDNDGHVFERRERKSS